MTRLPITIRLTLAFAAVMAGVLGGLALFLFLRMESALDGSMRDGLRSRADDVAALVQHTGQPPRPSARRRLTEVSHSPAQIVDPVAGVVGGTSRVGDRPLVSPDELRRARHETVITGRRLLPKLDDDPLRLLATPVDVAGRRLVVIVGASTDPRDEALGRLAAELLVGGPIALLLATLTAFGVARAALRPVESMRVQAAAISGAEPGRRLALPRTRDELRRLAETLNAMLARLQAAVARERAFAIDAGHEMRTPLAILKTELDVALRYRSSREDLELAVRSAAEETERLIRIAEDLLVIARSEEGRLPVRREASDVSAMFALVTHRFDRRAAEAGCTLEAAAPPGLEVSGDGGRLEQALGYLVDNALTHAAGVVRLDAVRTDGWVELHVLDDGPGLPPHFLAQAFERFSRADEAHSRGGAGLGLSVVAGIAAAHGGTAQVCNRPGGGADVWMSLPADLPSAPSPPAAGEAQPASAAPF